MLRPVAGDERCGLKFVMTLLETRSLSKYFGGLAAISQLDLDVYPLEILGLIGPNGAGKTTLFNVLNGFQKPNEGRVIFKEQDITGLKAHKIAQLGIGRAFQTSTLFMRLTVFDNVFNGFHMNYKEGEWRSFLHTPRARKEERNIKQRVMEILEFMGLAESKDQLAQNLPYGHQKILGVCIALATEPTLLLLDEPLNGMNPEETSTVLDLLNKVREKGITILLVEHNMDAVMRICDRIVVLNHGKKIAEGLPREIGNNKEVIDAYLGADEEVDGNVS